MASPWINTFATRPVNNQWCIIRVPYYYGAPVRARFKTSSLGAIGVQNWVVGDITGLAIPFYLVPRWKPDP